MPADFSINPSCNCCCSLQTVSLVFCAIICLSRVHLSPIGLDCGLVSDLCTLHLWLSRPLLGPDHVATVAGVLGHSPQVVCGHVCGPVTWRNFISDKNFPPLFSCCIHKISQSNFFFPFLSLLFFTKKGIKKIFTYKKISHIQKKRKSNT